MLSGCASTGTVHKAEVQRLYDSVEGVTYITHTPVMMKNHGMMGTPAVFMQTVAICKGDVTPPCDARYYLAFNVSGQQLTSSTNLTIRLGDRRIRPGSEAYDADVGGITRFNESMAYPITERDARQLAELGEGRVEGRLASLDLNLSYERRQAVRMLMSRFSETSASLK